MYSYNYTTTTSASGHINPLFGLVWLIVAVAAIVAVWRIFTKAGKPGWAAIVPFYNIYVLLQIVGRPGWWLILYFIPFVNIVVALVVAMDLAKSFGRSTAFGIFGLWLFSLIGYLILGFDNSHYVGPSVTAAPSTPAAPPAV